MFINKIITFLKLKILIKNICINILDLGKNHEKYELVIKY